MGLNIARLTPIEWQPLTGDLDEAETARDPTKFQQTTVRLRNRDRWAESPTQHSKY